MAIREPEAGALLAAPDDPGLPGVSVVTCSRNRSANLIRALPSWLACPEVAEVVVVDWGSDHPVADDLAAAGLNDPRIRLVRAEDEPRWILSLAFNLGFRLARCARLLKADADIVLDPDFFARNPLPPGFIAGNWRNSGADQAYVNGFFYIRTTDLRAVNGFNEYITTYGWDDDDLYDRLVAAGTARLDVAPGSVTHLDHDDSVRLNQSAPEVATGWGDLAQMAMFRIRTNRMLATMMPPWNRDRVMQTFRWRAAGTGTGGLSLERGGTSIHRVPPEQQAIAERLAAAEMLAWRAGLRAHDLTGRQLDLLLTCCRFETVSALRVELMLAGAGLAAVVAPRHLVADLDEGLMAMGPARLAPLAERVAAMAARSGRVLVWRAPRSRPPEALPPALTGQPFVPVWHGIGPVRDLGLDEAARDHATAVLRVVLRLSDLDTGAPPALPAPTPTPTPAPTPAPIPAPAVVVPRRRLWIDVQHGLGNRLRALGSAHAVAEATGRELVVVWQPDNHCQATFGDLFVPEGAVIAESFAARAGAEGATVLNYMEVEPGAAKGAPLVLDEGRDAYVRSAYVINHPASTWDSENRLLRRLVPAPGVAALVAGAPDHSDIGLHVRCDPATGDAVPNHDAPDNWTADGHAAIVHWRAQSRPAGFMARLDALLAEAPASRVFLAADRPDTYRAFAEAYGARLAWLDRPVFDRSAQQAQYALADLLLLARCRHLLGSNWSSFTEAALRLSTSIKAHERAGVEF